MTLWCLDHKGAYYDQTFFFARSPFVVDMVAGIVDYLDVAHV